MEIDAHHLIIATRYQLLDPKPVIWWREVSPSGSGWMSLNPYNPNPRWHPKNDYLLLDPGHKPTCADDEHISRGDRHYHHPSRVRARLQKTKS